MIKLTDVSKSFGQVKALDRLGFEAFDGQITGLLGPNGAGKTTALRCIYGLTEPDQGHVSVDQFQIPGDVGSARKNLGVFTDKFGLYDRLSTVEQLEYFAELNQVPKALIMPRINALVERLDMSDIAYRRTEGFSQGQRMKTGLARALVHEPKNLVLDEPTRGLDVMSTRKLRNLLRQLRDEGRCIVFSSHVMQEVAALCDRVVIMRDGKACAVGSPQQLCEQAGTDNMENAFIQLIGSEEGITY